MDSPKIYISGSIRSEFDLLSIKSATQKLRSHGFIVRTPHEICDGLDASTWEDRLKRCIAVMMECELVLMLDDWYDSKEAKIEYGLAKELSIRTEMYTTFINRLNLKPIA